MAQRCRHRCGRSAASTPTRPGTSSRSRAANRIPSEHRSSDRYGSFLVDASASSSETPVEVRIERVALAAPDASRRARTAVPGFRPSFRRARTCGRRRRCENGRATNLFMMNSQSGLAALSTAELLARTRQLVEHSRRVEADLLVYLGEIDERRLYLERAFPSMFMFCVGEYGFSEEAAYNRIMVARAGRRLPAVIEALRTGEVHLGGLRLLVPHLTAENHRDVLAEAAGKTKRAIEELVARLAPQPPVLPPLSEETFKVQFTASRALRDKLRQAQDLLRHRVRDGDLPTIVEKALDLLIEQVKKERFAIGRKPRRPSSEAPQESCSRHVPDEIRRTVHERDRGRCTFEDEHGRQSTETGAIELDHVDGFARTHQHQADRIRLLCRAHNQYEAERMYGRAFMERASSARTSTSPGTSSQPRLL